MTRRIVVDALQVPSEPTGVGRQVQAIGAALVAAPEDVSIELRCTREAAPHLTPSFPPRTVLSTPLARSTPRLARIAYQQLVAPWREHGDALVVCAGDQAPLFGRARRLLVVHDVRRLARPRSAPLLESLWYRLIVRASARRAHSVVTVSRFSAKEIRDFLGVEATVVACHPHPVADAPRPDGDGVLVVGALRPYKGIETAVEASRLAGVQLVLAGPAEGRTPDLAADAVDVAGWVSEERLGELYDRAAVVVAPSTYEGYGLPVAESLARGKPTVASDIPPHREVGDDAILYFPPGDARVLAERIRDALADRERLAARALERSRELAAARPGWAEVLLADAQ